MASSSSQGGYPPMESVIQDLLKGKELATQLKSLIHGSLAENPVAGDLMGEILGTISRAISALDAVSSPCEDDVKSEVSSGKRKAAPGTGNRRGGGYRRRTSSWKRIAMAKTLDDGHTWRKYGQKDIQNYNQPRSYFRCTHRPDQGCNAQRHVQRSEDDPSTYIITYIGEHTCRDPSTIIVEAPTPGESCLINFGSNKNTFFRQESSYVPMSTPFRSLKQEHCDEDVLSNLTPGSSSQTYAAPADQAATQITMPAPDQGDVTSSFHSIHASLDMSFMGASSSEIDDWMSAFAQDDFLHS
ncbi:transcription factor WRKY45-1-like [Typha latifolia]|uniref:transcription factor WRKY45-1-like n=1 Tax=Typha latifolia TaxID=4733 RepID=UPI003C2FC1BF